jgi:DNA polymerase III gamma/tau subunit
MTVEPFIYRYRPDKWDEVIGNEDSVTSLRKVLAEDSSHAFLFTGPSGVGKTTVARLAAKELGTTADNLIEVDAATHNGVEEMRDLAETLKYRPLGASNIKSIIVDECFHPNHELLTRYGWKHVNEVSENDEVMSFNGKTNECQFEPVLRTVQSQAEKLVELRGQQFHTLTTAGHEQPILNYNKELSRCFVKDLKKSYYLPIAGYIAETSRLSFEEKLKVAFEADGNLLYTNKTDGTKTYRFSFRRDRKIERLVGILTELNIPFKTSENSRFDTNIWFKSDIELTKTLLWFDPTQCVRRNIEFLNELVHWDGWEVPSKNEYYFESRNEEIADLVQLTAELSGCSASIKPYQHKDGRQPSWRVHWNTSEKVWSQIVQQLKITEVEYSGPVYCVTVPSGNVLTKLGKTISISGNCHSVTRQAWQSLLKIVEEPPSWAYWFFCTTDITPRTRNHPDAVLSLQSEIAQSAPVVITT